MDVLDLIRRGECPYCSRRGLKNVGLHIAKVHEESSADFRESHGLPASQPLCTPAHSDVVSAAAVEADTVRHIKSGAFKEKAQKKFSQREWKHSQHGTHACYRKGCRCDKCKAANAKAHLDWMNRKRSGLTVGLKNGAKLSWEQARTKVRRGEDAPV